MNKSPYQSVTAACEETSSVPATMLRESVLQVRAVTGAFLSKASGGERSAFHGHDGQVSEPWPKLKGGEFAKRKEISEK